MDQEFFFDWTPNPKKFYQTVCYVGRVGRNDVSIIRATATIFYADVSHLNAYGRTIYGENWQRAWHGPRPALLSGLMSVDPYVTALVRTVEGARVPGEVRTTLDPLWRLFEYRALSKSDRAELDQAYEAIEGRTDHQLVHDLRMHRAVLRTRGTRIAPEDFLEGEDLEAKIERLESELPYLTF